MSESEHGSSPASELLTQIEVEQQMYHGGIKRANGMMRRAEDAGRAADNPYSREIMQDYVLPLAAVVKADVNAPKAGAAQAHVALLRPLDADAVAYLAVRCALNHCMDSAQDPDDRNTSFKIGTAIHAELVLAQIEAVNPELYYTLHRDLGRRMSKNEKHRMAVMRTQARAAGVEWVEWPMGARQQVGAYLLGLLAKAGMVEIDERHHENNRNQYRAVHLAADLLTRISKIKDYIAITAPVYGPCVEPPLDWTTPTNGGFHTRELKRTQPLVVQCSVSARHLYREAEMPTVLAAINALQRSAWQVNPAILDTVFALSEAGVHTDEIVSNVDRPRPPPPGWLKPDTDKEKLSGGQKEEFSAWKRAMAEWHTEKRLAGVKIGRFYAATRAATMFREYPTLHFVHFADSRGRLYPMTYGVNPQGSDMQKALLRFAMGKPLDTDGALRWFHIQGANKWGFDKATLPERFMWAHERREEWLHYAADPVNHRGWMDADSPLQFLAWVLEYAEWVRSPDDFVSHLPISMDGSCNGLQNLSAMLRDEVGGRATNLTDNEVMEDIYRRVAEAALVRLQCMTFDGEKAAIQAKWIKHGISRSVVKRSVMTTPYGVTHRTATSYVIEDYLKHVKDHGFLRTEYRAAAQVLMAAVWPAIGDVVVKGREAMDWLKKGARAIIRDLKAKGEEPLIWWTSPSGFPACQAYFEVEVHRVNTRLVGIEKIRIVQETDEPDSNKHAGGLAPNFVHSMDAAHLHMVTAEAAASGRIDSLAMIHDDYGTHAADAEALYQIIREQFVRMYEWNDVIDQFATKYPCVPPQPSKGALDLKEVLRSKFFFS